MGRLLKRIACVRPEVWRNFSFNLHPNSLVHAARIVPQCLPKKKMVPVLSHPLYSLNLSPLDYFVVPKLKMDLKSNQYKNIMKIQKSVTLKLKAIPIQEREKAMNRLKDCSKECIHANGDYFDLNKKCVFYVFVLFRVIFEQ